MKRDADVSRRPAPGEEGLTLDLGCGRRKVPGAIGVDSVLLPGVDVVASLAGTGRGELPFRSRVARRIHARHVLEHLDDLVAGMEEIHRVAAPGALVSIAVPYFSFVAAFADPTHRRFFTYDTFAHFAAVPGAPGSSPTARPAATGVRAWAPSWQAARHVWFTRARYRVRCRRLRFGLVHRLLGIEWWANRLPHVYESFFPYVFPARELEVELEVVHEGD